MIDQTPSLWKPPHEIDRLRAEVAKLRATIEDMEQIAVAGDERIAELEAALRPFSAIIIEPGAIQEIYIRTADILAARAALAAYVAALEAEREAGR